MTDEIIFPPHKGWDPFSPTRTLLPDGQSYRDMQNFRLGDKFLQRRAMVQFPTSYAFPDLLPTNFDSMADIEFPIHLWNDNAGLLPVQVCITNFRILISFGGPWFTINPIHQSGTGANWLLGDDVITGVAALPGAYDILPGDLVTHSDGIVLGVVESYDFGLSEVTTEQPIARAPIGNADWQIRKSIQYNRAHFRVFNGDLYVAAVWERFEDNVLDPRDKWGVYRWTQIKQYPLAGDFADRVWLCASGQFDGISPPLVAPRQVQNNPNGNVADIPNNLIDFDSSDVLNPEAPQQVRVKGLDLLQDGRVVVPIASDRYDDRVFYSSQINDPQIHWNTSPGGFTDPVGIEGEIQVMGRLGNQLTLHYLHGISVGTPTGQDDPPLAFQPTRELQGCTYWRTLVNINPAVETFLGPDLQLYTFNGSSVELLGAHPKVGLAQPGEFPLPLDGSDFFASWDGYEREISIWRFRSNQGPQELTYRVVFNFEKGAWTRDFWNFFISAVSRDYGTLNPDNSPLVTDRERYALVGIPAQQLWNATEVNSVNGGFIRFLSETANSELVPSWITEPVPPSYVELDNFGLGEQTIEYEYVGVELAHVLDGLVNQENLLVRAYFDGSPTFPELRIITPLSAKDESQTHFFQLSNNFSGEKLRVRIELLGEDSGILRQFLNGLGVIRLGVNPVGEVRSEGSDVD